MSIIPSRYKVAMMGSKPFKWAFLFFALFFVKPVHFLPGQQTALASLLRRRWVRWLPFLPAGMFAKTIYGLLMWGVIHMQANQHAPDAVVHNYVTDVKRVTAATALFTALVIYGFSGVRYLFHRALVGLWKRLDLPGVTAPYNYYVVNTAAGATWFAAFGWALESFIEENGIDFSDALNRLVMAHVNIVLVVFFVLFAAIKRVSRNSSDGMRAVYGGSRARLLVADGLACALALVTLVLIVHLSLGKPATGG